MLRAAAASGATILFSSHQLELVEELCVDVAIIDGGRTVAHGDLGSIRGRADRRRVEVTVAGVPWLPDVIGARAIGGERPHVLVPASVTAAELLAAAARTGPITSFRYEAPSLADIFHEAVQGGAEAEPPAVSAGPTAGPAAGHGYRGTLGDLDPVAAGGVAQ